MKRMAMTALGSLLLIIGLLSMFTPIPGVTLLIAVACTLLICSSARMARMLRRGRARFGWLHSGLSWIEEKISPRLTAPLRSTRPDNVD